MFRVSYTDYVINEDIHKTIVQRVGHDDDLPAPTTRKRKLSWYRHVTLSSEILQGSEHVTRRREKQQKRRKITFGNVQHQRSPGTGTHPPELLETWCILESDHNILFAAFFIGDLYNGSFISY